MNWLDTPLLVYGALHGHPAEAVAEVELRHGDWGSTVLVLAELYHVLTQHYGLAPAAAVAEVERAARLPILWIRAEAADVALAAAEQARHRVEGADAALLLLAERDSGTLVTADRRLLRAALGRGVAARNPIPNDLTATIAEWESRRVPPKGIERLLATVERWLRAREPGISDEFVSATAQLTRPPT